MNVFPLISKMKLLLNPYRMLVKWGLGLVLTGIPFSGFAVQTDMLEQSGLKGFLGSELQNLSLTSEGIVQLAPELKAKAELGENLVLKIIPNPNGGWALSLGTRGRIVEVDEEGEMTERWVAGSLVRALAYDAEGNLWVGVSNGVRLFCLKPEKSPELVFQIEESYVWDMLFDEDDRLWVATGERGRLYRWDSANAHFGDKPELVYEAPARQLTTLAWSAEGELYIGSAPEGILLRRDTEGNFTAVYKSDLQEINQILPREGGEVWFSAMGTPTPKGPGSSGGSGSGATTPPTSSPSGNIGSLQTITSPQRAPRSLQGNGGNIQGILYRLNPTGFVDELWKLPRVAILGLADAGSQGVWVGTNHEGRLYQVTSSGEWSLVHELNAGKELNLLPLRDHEGEQQLVIVTSNPGRILVMSSHSSEQGTLQSSVLDAERVSRWGSLRVIANDLKYPQGIEVSTRNGNTPEPDSTWSEWEITSDHNGVLKSVAAPSRFLQYRIEFTRTEGESRLQQVIAYYQTPNEAPVVSMIRILDSGLGLEVLPVPPRNVATIPLEALLEGKSPFDQPANPRTNYRFYESPGLVSVIWKAEDSNQDPLEYTLYLKGEQDADWYRLVEKIEEPVYTLETLGLAEGLYQFKVVASDLPGNPGGDDLQGSRISQVFIVDNTPPAITRLEGMEQGTILLKVEDSLSRIVAAGYSWGGKPLKAVLPDDGMFDSRVKTFRVPVPSGHSPAQSGNLLFRVWDEAGNVSVYREVTGETEGESM